MIFRPRRFRAKKTDLRALARRTGYFEPDREADALLRDYADHTKKVRGIYDDLFAFTGEEGAPESSVKDYSALLDPETPEQEAVTLLGKLGFKDPGKAYRDLLLLREGTAFVHQTPRSRKLFNEIFPTLFQEIISSPDPDMALNHLESFLAAQGSWEAFQALMNIDPSAGKVLIAVFANSEYLVANACEQTDTPPEPDRVPKVLRSRNVRELCEGTRRCPGTRVRTLQKNLTPCGGSSTWKRSGSAWRTYCRMCR